ncbi:hypothetical protein BV20DRAFT_852609 [Pilatotrama ljubarskyi]|nr:hypothetical protein BV20DRAFT_852609 [Pilatotrama ljubarskyi]
MHSPELAEAMIRNISFSNTVCARADFAYCTLHPVSVVRLLQQVHHNHCESSPRHSKNGDKTDGPIWRWRGGVHLPPLSPSTAALHVKPHIGFLMTATVTRRYPDNVDHATGHPWNTRHSHVQRGSSDRLELRPSIVIYQPTAPRMEAPEGCPTWLILAPKQAHSVQGWACILGLPMRL